MFFYSSQGVFRMPYVKFVKTRRIEYVDVKVHEIKNAKSLAFLQGLFVFAPPLGLEPRTP